MGQHEFKAPKDLCAYEISTFPKYLNTERGVAVAQFVKQTQNVIPYLLTAFSFSLFMQNGNPQNPYCNGIEGVMEAYYQSLKSVRLYGPTHFSPVINHVAR